MTAATIQLSAEAMEVAERIQALTGTESLSETVNNLLLNMRGDGIPNDVLAGLIQEGLDSGEPVELTEEDWDDIFDAVEQRVADRKRQ